MSKDKHERLNNLRMILVLTGVSVICGFVLSLTFDLAKPLIADNENKYIEQSISAIAPGCGRVKEKTYGKKTVYELFDSQDSLMGYAYLTEGQGYQGKIKIIFAMDPGLSRILGMEVVDSVETPGLGARIREPFFKDQFRDLQAASPIECVKSADPADNRIQAITSATVSSKAVVSIINSGISELKSIINGGHE